MLLYMVSNHLGVKVLFEDTTGRPDGQSFQISSGFWRIFQNCKLFK